MDSTATLEAPATAFASTAPTPAESLATTAEIIRKVHEIGPILRAHSAEGEANRHLSPESIAAIESTGAFDIARLARYGGHEGGALMLAEVARTLAYYCAASGWVTVISNGSVMLTNRYEDSVVDEVFGSGETVKMASIFVSPHGFAKGENGGYRVAGEWPYSSNVNDSDWAIGILPVQREGAPEGETEIGFALMKRGEYTVKDTWHTVGMRATGSNTIVAEEVWIPADRICFYDRLMGEGFETDAAAPLGRRLTPMSTMATTISAPIVGAAQAALDIVAANARKRGVANTTYGRQNESGAFVKDLGEAAMKIDTSILHLTRAAELIDRTAQGTVPLTSEQRAKIRGDAGHSGHSTVEAMNELMWLAGSSAFAASSPLEKLWRDVNTGARHGAVAAPMSYEVFADGLVGADYIVPVL
jgi:3-hydroxy-9,10-secoandrosta-1,3,5(10)-triene-9,17-dione monooxygenase